MTRDPFSAKIDFGNILTAACLGILMWMAHTMYVQSTTSAANDVRVESHTTILQNHESRIHANEQAITDLRVGEAGYARSKPAKSTIPATP